jgi:hypothetical protein
MLQQQQRQQKHDKQQDGEKAIVASSDADNVMNSTSSWQLNHLLLREGR